MNLINLPIYLLIVLHINIASVNSKENLLVKKAISIVFPSEQIDSIEKSQLPGLIEVMLSTRVVYFSSDGKYMIDGELFGVKTKKNYSEIKKNSVRKKQLNLLSEAEQIIFPATGEKRHSIAIFTDIDCSYCRKMHSQIAEYDDLGIDPEKNYVHLL